MPEAQPLALLRQNIDRKSRKFRQVLIAEPLRKEILGVTMADEKKSIRAFADQNKENALKTKPKVRVSLLLLVSHCLYYWSNSNCLACDFVLEMFCASQHPKGATYSGYGLRLHDYSPPFKGA